MMLLQGVPPLDPGICRLVSRGLSHQRHSYCTEKERCRIASPSENRRALRSHPCVALSSRYPGKATTVYIVSNDWTSIANYFVLDMGSTLVDCLICLML